MTMTIILGNQLFPAHYYKNAKEIFMCEDIELCTHYRYHKHKIIFFLASMRNYRDELIATDKSVCYFTLQNKAQFFKALKDTVKAKKISRLEIYEIEDKFFEKKLTEFCDKNSIELQILKSPMFLVSRKSFSEYNSQTKKPFMKTFYESFRKNSEILMDKGAPIGGRFSFDQENRKKIPKKFDVIQNKLETKFDKNTKDVIKLVDKFFPEHPGESSKFWMHVTRKGALKELDLFLKQKFEFFGIYEDAIDTRDPFLYHSVLSPYINIGFLTPEEVVKKALKCDVSINSKEGFIRQIIGWREFVRGIYQEYSEVQEESNFFNHQNSLKDSWYTGNTSIVPLDDAIKKTLRFGYNHHIERLMIISNIMLLCEIHPTEVHKWFMEMYVDSSDWVMGPNVYGMAQFSDGGIFATKPYIASSNYILKMSHYKKDDWCETLDGLYWRFIHKNQDFFSKNYRMAMMVKMLNKIDIERKKRIFKLADEFISNHTIKGLN